ncbi:flippase [Vibrio parahaemolyticus]
MKLKINNSSLQKIIANSSWLLLDKISRIFLGLTVTAWTARYLGPESYGNLAYTLALVALCQTIAKLGLDTIVVRDISASDVRKEALLGTTLQLRVISGITIYFLVVLFSFLTSDIETAILFSLAGGAILFQSCDTIDLWFQSQSKSRFTVKAKLISYVIASLLKIGLIISSASIYWFAAIFSLETAITAMGLVFVYRKRPTERTWYLSKEVAIAKLKECFPYLVTSVSMVIYTRIDQIMIGNIIGSEELGVYSAILPFSTLWNVIPVILSISIAPYLAQLKKQNSIVYNYAISTLFSVFTFLGILTATVISFLSPYFVSIILGEQYANGIEVLRIHVLTNVFIYLGVAQGLWIVNEGKGYIALYRTLFGAAVSLVCNYYLLPIYGIVGAACVAVFAQLSQAVLSNVFFDRKILYLQIRCLLFIELFSVIKNRNSIR